jgi:hypothetical protein
MSTVHQCVYADSLEELDRKINKQLRRGWTLYRGIIVVTTHHRPHERGVVLRNLFVQALIKEF